MYALRKDIQVWTGTNGYAIKRQRHLCSQSLARSMIFDALDDASEAENGRFIPVV